MDKIIAVDFVIYNLNSTEQISQGYIFQSLVYCVLVNFERNILVCFTHLYGLYSVMEIFVSQVI